MAKLRTKASVDSAKIGGTYVLKLAVYILAGALWMKVAYHNWQIPLPVGLLLGLVFASHEHFQIDRKIEYAALLVAALFGYFTFYGIYIAL